MVGNSEVERPCGKHKRWREGNVEIDLKEMGYEGVDLILLRDRDRRMAVVSIVQ